MSVAPNAKDVADAGAQAMPSPALIAELEKTYATLGTGELEALLSTPSELRPGAEDLIRAEVARRQAERRG